MTILVYINQKPAGTLNITQEGLYTVFEAEVSGGADRLVRLWVHGKGQSAYLGVMQPWSEGLYLRRKLTRRELAAFPDPIELVSDREAMPQEVKGSKHKEVNINDDAAFGTPTAIEPDKEIEGLHNDRDALEHAPARETDYSTCPWPAEVPEEGLLWYRRADGSLTAFDGISNLLAIPAELRRPTPQMVERVIEGKKYLVFRT